MTIKITPKQSRKINTLIRRCCANCFDGNCLLLDRMSLSLKNGWIDEYGRVYQYFTVAQAQELLHFGHEKICKLYAELQNADLIERKRQGLGKASIIYLKKFL